MRLSTYDAVKQAWEKAGSVLLPDVRLLDNIFADYHPIYDAVFDQLQITGFTAIPIGRVRKVLIAIHRDKKYKDRDLWTAFQTVPAKTGYTRDGAAYMRDRKKRLKALGLCDQCGKRPPEEGKTKCRPCLDRFNASQKNYNAKFKAYFVNIAQQGW